MRKIMKWGNNSLLVNHCRGGGFFQIFLGTEIGLQVTFAGVVMLLVKYDPAGRNCLTPCLFLPLSIWKNTCSVVPLLPALMTVNNMCMHSRKSAFLHACLVHALARSQFSSMPSTLTTILNVFFFSLRLFQTAVTLRHVYCVFSHA